jgi:hypothetical protein
MPRGDSGDASQTVCSGGRSTIDWHQASDTRGSLNEQFGRRKAPIGTNAHCVT